MASSTGFQIQVLVKLATIIENQQEMLSLQRRMATNQGSIEDWDDVLPEPAKTDQQLQDLCDRLSNEQNYKKQLVCITGTEQLIIKC